VAFGIFYIHPLELFKELGLDSQRAQKSASNFLYILSTPLPNLSIPGAYFPVLLSALIRSRFQVKPAILLVPSPTVSFSMWWRSFTVPGTKVAPFPNLCGKWLHSLCSFFFFYLFLLYSFAGLMPAQYAADH